MANRIEFQVGYTVDKSGLNEIISALRQVQTEVAKAGDNGQLTNEFREASKAAQDLESILNSSWNSKLNQLDLSKLNNSIKSSYGSVDKLKASFEAASKAGGESGSAAATAYNKFASSVLNTNLQIKQTNKLLDEMATTMANTIKWGLTSSIFNKLTGTIQNAYSYTKNLDSSLNDIRIVTDKSANSMESFAKHANAAAKSLGASTLDYTKASLIYYQQGLSDEEVQARAETTLKAANVTGQTGDEVSEQLTAVWNGYKVTADEAELYVDKLAAVAAATASDLEELSNGMSKVASAASAMGVDVDQLNGMLATIISVTRQAPESAGTAMKTIFARMEDLELNGEDEFGVSLGSVSSSLNEVGISILDAKGEMRDLGEVIEEVGSKWNSGVWTDAEKQALAIDLAGKRQYNNLLALFENWDMYNEAVQISADSVGTLQKQQDIYMESTAAHLEQLRTEADKTYDILFDQNVINDFTDALTDMLSVLNNYLTGLNGGMNSIVHMGSVVANVFQNQIGKVLNQGLSNIESSKQNTENLNLKQDVINAHVLKGENVTNDTALEEETEIAQRLLNIRKLLTSEEYNDLTNHQQKIGALTQEITEIKNYGELLKGIGLREGDSSQTIENRIINKQEELNCQKDLLEYLELCNRSEEEQSIHAERIAELSSDIFEENSHIAEVLAGLGDEQLNILEATQSIETETSDIANLIERQRQLVQRSEQDINNANKALQLRGDIENGNLAKLEQEKKVRQDIITKTEEQAKRQKALSEMVSGLMTLVSLGTTIVGIWQTLNNEDLTAGEKAQAIITTLLASLPMIIMNFNNIASILPGMATGLSTMAIGLAGVTGAELSTTAATESLTSALGLLWRSLRPILPEILAIAAAIAAVIGITYLAIKAYNADANAAKEASEQVETLTNKYNELTEAAKNLKETISEYDDQIKALDDLTKGTDEYKEALEQANEKAKELIETYGLFDNYHIEDGLIKIDEDKLAEKQSIADSNAVEMGKQLYGAKIVSEQANLKNQTTNLSRSIGGVVNTGYQDESGQDVYRQFTSTELQAAATAIQNVIDNNEGLLPEGDKLKEDLLALDDLPDAIKENINAIVSNKDSLKQLADSMNEASSANKYYAKQILEIEVKDKYSEDIEKLSNGDETRASQLEAAITAVGIKKQEESGSSMDEEIAAIDVNKAYSNTALNEILKAAGKEEKDLVSDDKDLALKYAKMLNPDLDENTLTYKGGWNKGTVKDESGNTIVDSVSDDVMRHALAKQAQIDQITENYTKQLGDDTQGFVSSLDKMIEASDNFGKQFSADFTGSLLDAIANGGDLDFTSLFSSLSPSEVSEILDMDSEDLAKSLGLTDEQMNAMGFKSAQAFGDGFKENLQQQFDNATISGEIYDKLVKKNDLNETAREEINSDEGLTEDTRNSLKSQYGDDVDWEKFDLSTPIEQLQILNELQQENNKAVLDNYEAELEVAKARQNEIEQTKETLNELKNKADFFQKQLSSGNLNPISVKELENIQEQIDETSDKLEELEDEEIEIKIDLDTSQFEIFENTVDSIVSEADALKSAAELIGEGFIVAKEDAEEFAKIYPALLEQSTVLADGQIQLNQGVVQSIMNGNSAVLTSDANKTAGILENQIAVLDGQIAYQETVIQNLQDYIAGEQSASDTVNNIKSAAATYESNLTEGLTNDQIAAFNKEMEGSKTSTDTALTNLDKIGQRIALVSEAYAKMLTGEQVSYSSEGATGIGGSVSDFSSTFNADNYKDKTLEGQSAKDLLTEAQSKLKNLQDSRAKYTALLSELRSGATEATDAMAGAASGTGGKKDTSKSGSGSDAKDPDTMDYLEDEKDRYHDINLELEELDTNLSRIQKQQEKLYGKDLISNLNKQLEILEKQKDAYSEKLSIAKAETQELKDALSLQGVSFDSDGYISNYSTALQAKLDYVNNLIAQYNAMSAEEQETFKDTVENAKEEYEDFKDKISDYDELISSTIPDIEDSIQDAVDKEIEINISKFTMEVELRLDMAEAERDFNEFKRKVIDGIKDDDIVETAESKLKDFTSYFDTEGFGTGPIQALTDQVNKTMDQIEEINNDGWSTIYGDNKNQAMEDLTTYYEELMNQLEDIVDLVDEIHESYLDMIDEATEAFDDQVEQYEYIQDLLDHNVNIIGLIYGDKAYTQMETYYYQIEQNNNQQLDFLKKRVAYAEEMMQKETDPDALKKWKEEWEDALSDLNSKVEDSIQNIIDKYTNAINKTFDELNKKITNNKGLDYVNDEWDLINDNADQYLDTINSMYAVQQLENKYLEALDSTDSLSAQKKLNDMMTEQLGMLESKDKLTQYDVDRANALYEITLKQIALEEAQQNKSKMRLRRDSQGNYSYQFVSDEDSIAQAQQDLLAAQNDLYNLDKDKYKENLNEIYEYYVEFQEKYTKIMTDMSLTDEERQERTKLLQEQYGELINGLVEQNEEIKQNLQESTFIALEGLYAKDADAFKEMTGQDIEAFRNLTDTEKDLVINNLVPQWTSGVQQMADVFAGEGGLIPTCQEAFNKLDEATKEYQDSLDELEDAAGIDFDSISEGYDENIEKAQELLDANDDLINKYADEVDAILEVISQLDELVAKYQEAQAAAEAATAAAYAFAQAEKNSAAEAASDEDYSSSSYNNNNNNSNYSTSSSSESNSSSNGSGSGGGGTPRVGDVVTYTGGLYYYDSEGTSPTGSRGPGKRVTITKIKSGAAYPIHVQSSDSAYGWLREDQISGYDTGGYTGDWNSSGKLAVLHQKELVLNSSDTENMLSAVKVVRDIAGVLSNIQSNIASRISNLVSGFGGLTGGISASADTLEQNVHIEANFPNVQNSNEIQDALNNLVNIASQRANNQKR